MKMSELLDYESNRDTLNEIKSVKLSIVPFVGAGVSQGCGLFSWKGLLAEIARKYMSEMEIDTFKKGNPITFADEIALRTNNSDMISREIRENIRKKEVKLTTVPRILLQEFSPLVITTNYDKVLEQASTHSKRGKITSLLPCLQGQMNDAVQLNEYKLLKIHGSIEETSSIVFSSKQYQVAYSESGIVYKYLSAIYKGKRVLFVGCSLTEDLTVDLLRKCRKDNEQITHYAFVQRETNKEEYYKRNTQLASLGIIPIYYPEGDYEAIEKMMNYIAAGEVFSDLVRSLLNKVTLDTIVTQEKMDVLLSIVSKCFCNTADKYIDLYDIQIQKTDSSELFQPIITKMICNRLSMSELVVDAFEVFLKYGCIDDEEIMEYFKEVLFSSMLEESDITSYLERFVMDQDFPKSLKDVIPKSYMTDSEVNRIAIQLTDRIKYVSGMTFDSNIAYYLEVSKSLYDIAGSRINIDNRIPLLRNMGVMCLYYKQFDEASNYSQEAIELIESTHAEDLNSMKFLSGLYNNLAMAEGYRKGHLNEALKANAMDLEIKRKYGIADFSLLQSQDFHATIQKELNPFLALDAYIDCYDLKKSMIDGNAPSDKMMISLATTIFNTGLLAKDIGEFKLAYRLVKLANIIRFELLAPQNKDYCSSINVASELEVLLQHPVSSMSIRDAIEKRIDLPTEFSNTLPHTWYVCALFFYSKGNFKDTIEYIGKMRLSAQKDGTFFDLRQNVRGTLLLAKAKYQRDGNLNNLYKDLTDAENSIINEYGEDSYYLLEVLEIYKEFGIEAKNVQLSKLSSIYQKQREQALRTLDSFTSRVEEEIVID